MNPALKNFRHFGREKKFLAWILMGLLPVTTLPNMAFALPHGGVVTKGTASLGYSTNKLLIYQSTNSATFNWSSFNVKSGQFVIYAVPGSSSTSMNFIGGTTPSLIRGTINSNGILYFMNPNGLIFGSGSVVNAAGVMAFAVSQPWGNPSGSVSNAGSLSVTKGGTITLTGTKITNSGTISAPGGTVILGAGATVEPLETTGSTSLSVVTTGAGILNDSGIISAQTVDGRRGQITLKGGAQSGTVSLDSTAILDASAPTGGNGGSIETSASRVNVANDALVTTAASKGSSGTWTLDPASFYIGRNTGSANTTKGNLLGYEDISGTTLGSLLQNGNIVIDSTSGANGSLGNIYVNDPISWSSANSLALNAVNNIEINNQIKNTVTSYSNTQTLTGGGMTISYPNTPLLVLRADDMDIGGSATNTSGGVVPSGVGSIYINSGGSLDVNGPVALYYNPTNYLTPTSFTNLGSGTMTAYMLLSSNPDIYYIDQHQTSQILSNNYALNASLPLPSFGSLTNTSSDMTQINFASSANGVNTPSSSTYSNWVRFGGFHTGSYKGSFDGLKHSVSNMVIYDSAHVSSGFFGYVTQGTIANFGISSGSIYASNTNVNYYVGGYGGFAGLSGENSILINDFSKVTVTGAAWAGGFIGQLCPTAKCGGTQAGVVMDSFSSGNVNTTGSVSYVDSGGFVGDNEGDIFNSYESGNISGQNTVGGFAGIVSGNAYSSLIINSYAIGNVKGGMYVGGFVGYDRGPGQIIDSFSSGTVNASSNEGGFSGSGGSMGNGNPVVTNSYWNLTTSGLHSSYNGIGLTSSQFKSSKNFTSWGFNSWGSNAWQASIMTSPWLMTASGPVLIPDMPRESIDGKSGTAIYTGGTISPGFVAASTQGTTPLMTSFSTSVGPNVGAYLNTPFVSTLSAPTAQSSIGSYSVSSGVYSITPASLSLSTPASKTYNGSPSVTLSGSDTTLSGMVSGQTSGAGLGTPVTGTFMSANAGPSVGGSVALSAADLTGNGTFVAALTAGDYLLPTTFTGGTIAPASLTVTGVVASNKVYDGTTAATLSNDGTLSGLVGSQTVTLTSPTSANFSQADVGNGLTVTASGYTLGTGANGFNPLNYTFNPIATTTANITPASLSLSTTASKTYNGSPSVTLSGSDTTLSGMVSGQTSGAGLGTPVTGTFMSANAGPSVGGSVALSAADLTGNGTFVAALTAGDYLLPTTFTGGTIAPASLTVTSNHVTTTSGSPFPPFSGSYSTIVSQSVLAANGFLIDWTTSATPSSSLGTYPIFGLVNGSLANDFQITQSISNADALTIITTPFLSTQNGSFGKGSKINPVVPVLQTVQYLSGPVIGSPMNTELSQFSPSSLMNLTNFFSEVTNLNLNHIPSGSFNPLILFKSGFSSIIILSPNLFDEAGWILPSDPVKVRSKESSGPRVPRKEGPEESF